MQVIRGISATYEIAYIYHGVAGEYLVILRSIEVGPGWVRDGG